MHLAKLSPYLLTVCLFLLFPAYTYAQDTTDTTNDNHKIELGLGGHYLDRTIMDKRQSNPNTYFFDFSINYSYRLADFYHMGIENRFIFFALFYFGDMLLYTHEFDIFHVGSFTFQTRFSVGVSYFYVDGFTDYEVRFPNKHKFAIPLDFGLGFNWRPSNLISLRIVLGITDNIIVYTHNNNKVAIMAFEKDSYSFKSGIAANLSFRVGFHF